MADHTDTVWLTQASYDKLRGELEDLKGPVRDEIVARVAAAREEGDLSENAGYHAAREQLGQLEGRIVELGALLDRAQVGSDDVDTSKVGPGSVVTARLSHRDKDMRFLLGSREMSGEEDLQVYSPQSPMGQAVVGAKVGDHVSYVTPSGKEIDVEIVAINTL